MGKLKKLCVVTLMLTLLAGCSTNLTQNQIEAMSKDTLSISCDSSCQVDYTDPRDRMQMPTNGWDTANNAINAVSGVITSTSPWAAITLTGMEAVTNAGNNDESVVTNTSTNIDNTDNTNNSIREIDNSIRNIDNSSRTLPQPTNPSGGNDGNDG
jgi:uncharacterized protein YcfL